MSNPQEGERLQKILARLGVGSRRVCEDLIRDGRITVNGEEASLGQRVDVDNDHVEIDGSPVPVRPDLVHRLLHKPAKVVCTSDDPQGRTTVVGLMPDDVRVFPVGRLDYETEGLLIMTNNGDLAHRLTHPSFGVDQEYLAHVDGTPDSGAGKALREGVELEDGITAPAKISVLQDGLVRLVIHEGPNRQVRRMCEAVGHPVLRLVRTRIGPISDPGLAAGSWRELSHAEVTDLYRSSGEIRYDHGP